MSLDEQTDNYNTEPERGQQTWVGGLPPIAVERIKRPKREGPHSFSSSLSTNEFLLAREIGAEPLAMVIGTSFYNLCLSISKVTAYTSGAGYGHWDSRTGFELPDLTEGQQSARKLAVARMKAEASLLGASGIVGVRLVRRQVEQKRGIFEFKAIGTAIRLPNWKGTATFTTGLNAQEFWQLYQNDYNPCKLAIGASSYYIRTDWSITDMLYNWSDRRWLSSQELDDYSIGFSNARSFCMKKLEEDAQGHDIEGIVGADLSYHIEPIEYEKSRLVYHDVLINIFAQGTTIGKSDRQSTKPTLTLPCYDLASGKYKSLVTTEEVKESKNVQR